MQRVCFFHTTLNTPKRMKEEFQKRYPNVELLSIVEDGLLPEVNKDGRSYTPELLNRLIEYGKIAQDQGVCVIVDMCTTLGIAVKEAQKALKVPFITIDHPMLVEAAKKGKRIALLVTAPTTVKASGLAAKEAADEVGNSDARIDTILVDGAFKALNVEKNKEKHDKLIFDKIVEIEKDYDVIALGQVTMADVAGLCKDIKTPVLTSIKLGIEQIDNYLR